MRAFTDVVIDVEQDLAGTYDWAAWLAAKGRS